MFALIAATLAFIHFRQKPPETPLLRLTLAPPEKGRFLNGSEGPPAASPDGTRVVFPASSAEGKTQLWLRSLDALKPQPIAGTEKATFPFWSPDSKWIGFFAGGKLKKMDVSGGPATTLADATNARGGTWNQDGVIVFAPAPAGGLQQIAASGGVAHPVTRGDKKSQRFPWFLPDGKHFLYLIGGSNGLPSGLRVCSLSSPAEVRLLLDRPGTFAIYAQGYLLFARGATLVARPFDVKRLAFTGEAVPVAEPVQISRAITNLGEFSVSANGVLVYEEGSGNNRLTWLDRAGKRLGTVGEAGDLLGLQFSPDRKTVAATVRESSASNGDIWLYDRPRS